jgi:hypothetical protein
MIKDLWAPSFIKTFASAYRPLAQTGAVLVFNKTSEWWVFENNIVVSPASLLVLQFL